MIVTTEDKVITMPSRIRGIERFAVPPDHHAYNSRVSLLLDDKDNNLKEILKGGIAKGDMSFVMSKRKKNRTDAQCQAARS